MFFKMEVLQAENITKIKDWVKSKRPDIGEIEEDYDIISNRIIDSLLFMELVYLIEHLSGKEIDFSNLSVEDFSTLNNIKINFFN